MPSITRKTQTLYDRDWAASAWDSPSTELSKRGPAHQAGNGAVSRRNGQSTHLCVLDEPTNVGLHFADAMLIEILRRLGSEGG